MKNAIAALFYTFILGLQALYAQPAVDASFTDNFRINSHVLNEERTLFINLPDSYNDTTEVKKKYPLLILLDGATHFNITSGIVHFLSANRTRNHLMPETIIVAIENVNRERDFTVTKIKTKRPNSMGGGKNFLNFIENELIPYVDKNYRTETYRTLVGHSLGGLLALNAYMDDKSAFDAYIAIDPSIWWSPELTKEKVDAIKPVTFNKKLYIATAGLKKERYVKNKKRHEQLYRLLQEKAGKGWRAKIDFFENENHRTVPLTAIDRGLRFLHKVAE